MILTYNAKESFVKDILEGRKIHTIRADKNDRWHVGRKIHHWWRNPRNRHLNPYCFLENACTGVQRIRFYKVRGQIGVAIEGTVLPIKIIKKVAANDGLTYEEFTNYFMPKNGEILEGKIIHWTDFRY